MTVPLLGVEGLSGGYGLTEVLHNVSLQVRGGEIVALLGANGAGKTSLLNAVLGLLPAIRGSVKYRGESLAGATEQIVRRGISLVPERRQLFGTMTVEENLRLGAYTRKDRAGIRPLLEQQYVRFPILAERRRQLAQTMSGGQQQMLAIGRALMSEPNLLLLDEPSLGLAPLIVGQVFEEIMRIRDAGGTVLLVEQNARAALRVATRAYVMETGRVGPAREAADMLADSAIATAYLGGGDDAEGMEQRIRRKADAYRALGAG
jgi:branched-chain amino acid transport system ATP-binding protein